MEKIFKKGNYNIYLITRYPLNSKPDTMVFEVLLTEDFKGAESSLAIVKGLYYTDEKKVYLTQSANTANHTMIFQKEYDTAVKEGILKFLQEGK